jgi:hypothetical protein
MIKLLTLENAKALGLSNISDVEFALINTRIDRHNTIMLAFRSRIEAFPYAPARNDVLKLIADMKTYCTSYEYTNWFHSDTLLTDMIDILCKYLQDRRPPKWRRF